MLSQTKTKEAQENNYFAEEIVPVSVGDKQIVVDEHPKGNTTKDGLSKLKPAFKTDVS